MYYYIFFCQNSSFCSITKNYMPWITFFWFWKIWAIVSHMSWATIIKIPIFGWCLICNEDNITLRSNYSFHKVGLISQFIEWNLILKRVFEDYKQKIYNIIEVHRLAFVRSFLYYPFYFIIHKTCPKRSISEGKQKQ